MLTDNGSNLSQGQRQLLSISRAAVADPPVMILDEATSSIDTRTEAIVQKGMDALMSGRTTFVIAHRLSTVRNSDAIIGATARAPGDCLGPFFLPVNIVRRAWFVDTRCL
mgnify:CR=1 FL=1